MDSAGADGGVRPADGQAGAVSLELGRERTLQYAAVGSGGPAYCAADGPLCLTSPLQQQLCAGQHEAAVHDCSATRECVHGCSFDLHSCSTGSVHCSSHRHTLQQVHGELHAAALESSGGNLRYGWDGSTHLEKSSTIMGYLAGLDRNEMRTIVEWAHKKERKRLKRHAPTVIVPLEFLTKRLSRRDRDALWFTGESLMDEGKSLGRQGAVWSHVLRHVFAPWAGPRVPAADALSAAFLRRYSHLRTVTGHRQPAYCLLFDRSDRRVLTGGDDGAVKIWCLRTGTLLHALRGHAGCISDMAIDAGNRLLATASLDGHVVLWELGTGNPLMAVDAHSPVLTVEFRPAPDGAPGREHVLMATCADGHAKFWAVDAQQRTASEPPLRVQCRSLARDSVRCAAFSPGGVRFVIGATDGIVRLHRVPDVAEIRAGALSGPDGSPHVVHLDEHEGYVNSVHWSTSGTTLATSSWDGTLRLWFYRQMAIMAAEAHKVYAMPTYAAACLPPGWQCRTLHTSDALGGPAPDGRPRKVTIVSHCASDKCLVAAVGATHELIFYAASSVMNLANDQAEDTIWDHSSDSDSVQVDNIDTGSSAVINATGQSGTDGELSQLHANATARQSSTESSQATFKKHSGTMSTASAASAIDAPATVVRFHSGDVFVLNTHPLDDRVVLSAGCDGRAALWLVEARRGRPPNVRLLFSYSAPGARFLDGGFCSAGDYFGLVDDLGRVSLFGAGVSPDAYARAAPSQFFPCESRRIIFDSAHMALDAETQRPASVYSRDVLLSIDGRAWRPSAALVPRSSYAASLSTDALEDAPASFAARRAAVLFARQRTAEAAHLARELAEAPHWPPRPYRGKTRRRILYGSDVEELSEPESPATSAGPNAGNNSLASGRGTPPALRTDPAYNLRVRRAEVPHRQAPPRIAGEDEDDDGVYRPASGTAEARARRMRTRHAVVESPASSEEDSGPAFGQDGEPFEWTGRETQAYDAYLPQLHDSVVYVSAAHRALLDALPEREQWVPVQSGRRPVRASLPPWRSRGRPADLPEAVHGTVVGLSFLPGPWACVDVEPSGGNSPMRVYIRPWRGVPLCLVYAPLFRWGVAQRLRPGDSVRLLAEESTYDLAGTVESLRVSSAHVADAPWHAVAVRTGDRVIDVCPWEIAPEGRAGPPAPECLSAGAQRSLSGVVSAALRSRDWAPFADPVPLDDFPDYPLAVGYPCSLRLVQSRLRRGFYRRPASVLWDVAQISRNACAYNEARSTIVAAAADLVAVLHAEMVAGLEAVGEPLGARDMESLGLQEGGAPGDSDDRENGDSEDEVFGTRRSATHMHGYAETPVRRPRSQPAAVTPDVFATRPRRAAARHAVAYDASDDEQLEHGAESDEEYDAGSRGRRHGQRSRSSREASRADYARHVTRSHSGAHTTAHGDGHRGSSRLRTRSRTQYLAIGEEDEYSGRQATGSHARQAVFDDEDGGHIHSDTVDSFVRRSTRSHMRGASTDNSAFFNDSVRRTTRSRAAEEPSDSPVLHDVSQRRVTRSHAQQHSLDSPQYAYIFAQQQSTESRNRRAIVSSDSDAESEDHGGAQRHSARLRSIVPPTNAETFSGMRTSRRTRAVLHSSEDEAAETPGAASRHGRAANDSSHRSLRDRDRAAAEDVSGDSRPPSAPPGTRRVGTRSRPAEESVSESPEAHLGTRRTTRRAASHAAFLRSAFESSEMEADDTPVRPTRQAASRAQRRSRDSEEEEDEEYAPRPSKRARH